MGHLSFILDNQNRDGGWPYLEGSSSTEPTALALMALCADGRQETEACRRGLNWLRRNQRPDGGWAPKPYVAESTWVTALPLFLTPGLIDSTVQDRAVYWLLRQSGRESSLVERLRWVLLGVSHGNDVSQTGWPWYPEASAWVPPTALTTLALERVARSRPSAAIDSRREAGRKYLLSRMCLDGGWNHGSTRALGYDMGPYPETTGVGLLALHGAGDSALGKSLALAEKYYASERGPDAVAWLALGLMANGRRLPDRKVETYPVRTVMDAALLCLSESAAEGRNAFLDPVR